MKSKGWIAAAAVLTILGLAVIGAALACAHGDINAFGSAKFVTETVDIAEDFSDIAITASIERISFAPSGDGKCRVEFYRDERSAVSAAVSGDALEIKAVKEGKWYENISFLSFGSPRITVYLPKTEYGALTVSADTGSVTLPEAFAFAGVDVRTDTGDVDIASRVSGALRVNTDTGCVACEGISAGSIDIAVSTGRVRLASVECAGSLGVAVTTGKTTLTGVTCASFCSEGSTGDLTLENVICSGGVIIERSTGDVKFVNCDGAELDITTDTGDVTGSLRTDKVFIVKSDTGRIDVPETTSGGKCRIISDTGDIKISVGAN